MTSQRVYLSKPAVIGRLKRLEALGLVKKIGHGTKVRYKLI